MLGRCTVVASPGRVLYTSSFPFVSAGGAQFTAASPLLPYSEGEFPGSSTLFSHCKNSNGRTAQYVVRVTSSSKVWCFFLFF